MLSKFYMFLSNNCLDFTVNGSQECREFDNTVNWYPTEFDEKPVCDCLFCVTEENLWVVILVILLILVLLNLIISIMKDNFYIIRNK